jgi:hypothetical protein
MRSSIEFAALASYYKEETWETETDYRPENGNVAASCADRKQISCGLAKHKPDTCEEGGDGRLVPLASSPRQYQPRYPFSRTLD